MGKDGFMTAKAIGNRIKSKGLQKLRWFCQMCQKQCRDANGFKCHCATEQHQRQMLLFAETPGKYLESYSSEFLSDFLKLFKTRYSSKRVRANQVYQEYISDKLHLHLNATKWSCLTDLVHWMGRQGICEVEDSDMGLWVTYVDKTPETIARQRAIEKKERGEKTEEERNQKVLEEQLEKAKNAAEEQIEFTELKRDNEVEKIKLSSFSLKPKKAEVKKNVFSLKKKSLPSASTSASPSSSNPVTSQPKTTVSSSSAPILSSMQMIMQTELERKNKRKNHYPDDRDRKR